MAAIRATSSIIMKGIFSSSSLSSFKSLPMFPRFNIALSRVPRARPICYSPVVRCAAGESDRKKTSSRLSQVQQVLHEAQERAKSAGNDPIPKITIDHVSVSFARSGGPGGQNVNKVNTKVDMRFNVKDAYWLSDRVKERIMQVEKNRINKDGEIVISSTKTRTQKGNIEDALGKLQAIIDAASYVPPPPSEEQMRKIAKIAATGEKKRLQSKKILSDKKAFRRSRNSVIVGIGLYTERHGPPRTLDVVLLCVHLEVVITFYGWILHCVIGEDKLKKSLVSPVMADACKIVGDVCEILVDVCETW